MGLFSDFLFSSTFSKMISFYLKGKYLASIDRLQFVMDMLVLLDLGERRRGQCPQVAATPPDGVVSAGWRQVKQTLPLSPFCDHAQFPVLTVTYKHLHR